MWSSQGGLISTRVAVSELRNSNGVLACPRKKMTEMVGYFDEEVRTYAKILFEHMSIWSTHVWVSPQNGWHADMLKVFQKIESCRPM